MWSKKVVASLLMFLVFFLPNFSLAATLSVSPSTINKKISDTFSVDVFLSSPQQAANAISGTFRFNPDIVQIKNTSIAGSIVNLWTQAPVVDNSGGTVIFEGIVLNPGFSGQGGKIFSVTFVGKKEGVGKIDLVNTLVLANDGAGTPILTSTSGSSVQISDPVVVPESTEEVPPSREPTVEIVNVAISSPTHPDQNMWYRGTTTLFEWSANPGATAVRLLFDDQAEGVPTVLYDEPIKQKEIADLEDGIWYLHAQFRQNGKWGDVQNFRIQVDNTPPLPFNIEFLNSESGLVEPRPIAMFNTSDTLSGISHYEIKIGDGDFFKVDMSEVVSGNYALPTQNPGSGTLMVRAVDRAGNITTSTQNFEVVPLPSPRIISYLDTLEKNDIIFIQGETLPSVKLIVSLMDSRGDTQTLQEQSNLGGKFRVIWPKRLDSGVYYLSVVALDDRGNKSEPSETIMITVKPSVFWLFGSQTASFVSFVTSLILLLVGFVCVILKAWRMIFARKVSSQKEMDDPEFAIAESFASLHKKTLETVALLEQVNEKRRLTKEEQNILSALKKEIGNVK